MALAKDDPRVPDTGDIVDLRRRVQQTLKLRSDSAGKELCGEVVHGSFTGWTGWETGKSNMHPAFWELANIKLTQILTAYETNNQEDPLLQQWLPRITELQTRKRRTAGLSEAAQQRKEQRKAAGF